MIEDKELLVYLEQKEIQRLIDFKTLNEQYYGIWKEKRANRNFNEEDKKAVRKAVEKLPQLERFIIYLRYWKDLTPEEIAAFTFLRCATIKMLERSALERLSNYILNSTTAQWIFREAV